jgi:hypothetical protein
MLPQMILPAKVVAAQNFAGYALAVRMPDGGVSHERLPLSAREQATYDAALDVLQQYFRGEMDFGDPRPGFMRPDEPEPPQAPVPTPEPVPQS